MILDNGAQPMDDLTRTRVRSANDREREDEIGRLDGEIKRLIKERSSLEEGQNEEYIKSLVWTRDCEARLEVSPLLGAGLPKYRVLLVGNDIPRSLKSVTVMGDSRFYENNVLFTSSSYGYAEAHFYTTSGKTLIEFLRNTNFKSVSYDKELLEVLLVAKEVE